MPARSHGSQDDVSLLLDLLTRAIMRRDDRVILAATVAHQFLARTGLHGVIRSAEDDKVAVANHYMSAAGWLLHEHYQETTGDEDAPF